MISADVLRVLVLLALVVSGICLVLTILRVSFSIPAWVVWAILTLLCLLFFLGIR